MNLNVTYYNHDCGYEVCIVSIQHLNFHYFHDDLEKAIEVIKKNCMKEEFLDFFFFIVLTIKN